MLGTLLAQHPQIAMHGELFGNYPDPLNFYGVDENLAWPTPLETRLKKIRDADCKAFLDEWVFADTGRDCSGFKFKVEEFTLWPGVVEYICENRLVVLLLERKDALAPYVSEVCALSSGVFNSNDKSTTGSISAPAEHREIVSRCCPPRDQREPLVLRNGFYSVFQKRSPAPFV